MTMASATVLVYNYKIFFPSCTTSLNAGPILATVCWTCFTTTSNSVCSEQHVNSTLPPIFCFPLLLTWLPPLPPHPHQSLFRLERLWRSLVTLSSILHLFIWSLGSVFSFPHTFIVNVSSFVYPCGCCLNLGHHYFLCGLLQKPPYLTIYFCPPSSLFSSLLSLK